jgi:1-deoxy-D-xylulose-5-phosphate reductoisomerase
MKRRISIFGATGSIGRNTVRLVEAQGGVDAYDVVALSGGQNVALLAEKAIALRAERAVIAESALLADLEALLEGTGVQADAGPEALEAAAAEPADWTMSAIVGAAGLRTSLAAARHGGVLALANKESLVCAGGLLKRICAAAETTLLPVDSEHSAIFQALRGERTEEVERIILTASGGPFRTWTERAMLDVTPEQARAHPTWDMGERISIDSATMFNKALEVIETHALFGTPPSRIEVVVHPQSIIHSIVCFADGSMMAQMGPSDMMGPIGYALNWPERRPLPVERLALALVGPFEFADVDTRRFPALRLAREALEIGGLAGAVLNAAKEVALDAFIQRRIGFLDMAILAEHVMNELAEEAGSAPADYGLDDVMAHDAQARRLSLLWVDAYTGS